MFGANRMPPDGWQPLLDWLSSPNKNAPDRAKTIAALNAYVQATRIENTQVDQKMLDALNQNKNTRRITECFYFTKGSFGRLNVMMIMLVAIRIQLPLLKTQHSMNV